MWGEEIELDDFVPIGGIGEGKAQILGVALGLLEPGLRWL